VGVGGPFALLAPLRIAHKLAGSAGPAGATGSEATGEKPASPPGGERRASEATGSLERDSTARESLERAEADQARSRSGGLEFEDAKNSAAWYRPCEIGREPASRTAVQPYRAGRQLLSCKPDTMWSGCLTRPQETGGEGQSGAR
jgi:hypothetical protein